METVYHIEILVINNSPGLTLTYFNPIKNIQIVNVFLNNLFQSRISPFQIINDLLMTWYCNWIIYQDLLIELSSGLKTNMGVETNIFAQLNSPIIVTNIYANCLSNC